MLTHGVDSAWSYFVACHEYEQAEIVPDIVCPTLVCDAEHDVIAMFSREVFDQLQSEKMYVRFAAAEGAGAHCACGARGQFHARVFDWIDEQLARRTALPEGAVGAS